MSNAVPKARRGRPVTTDPTSVSLAALRLFDAQGIDQVTMDDVAAAAGISRSNLFRIFPSKAAVVWGGLHQFNDVLEANLKNSKSEDLVNMLHTSWVSAMQVLDESLEVLRLRLKLIGSNPEVYGWGQGQLNDVRRLIAEAVRRNGGDQMRSEMVSAALVSASMAIMIHWAKTNDPRTPSEMLDQSFTDFEKLFARS